MFGKLKDKLKGAMSVFSKKTEEEAEVKEEVKVEDIVVEKKESVKKRNKKVEKKEIKKKDKIKKKEKVIEHPSDKTVLEKVHEEKAEIEAYEEKKGDKVSEEVSEKKSEESKKENKIEESEEKKGLFGKIKNVFSSAKEEEQLEKAEEEVKELKKEKVVDAKGEPEEETKSFLSKVKESVTTKKISGEKFEELFWDLEMVLLENNVSVEVIEKIKENLKEELVDKPLPRNVSKKIEETLKSTMDEILTHDKVNLIKKVKAKKGSFIITFFGINGSGKTTSIAKLANYLKGNKLSVVLAACDTFRAAAIQQLQEHADKLDVPMIKHDYGSDAAAVAFDAIKYAEKNKIDVVLIDTAGRLHSNTNLMAELEKIIRITKPDMKIFVGESITGNDCIEQAKKFNELVQMDGAILTKVDVDDKGGAPLSISYTIGKPILFLGIGQEYKDFEEFDKNKILERLF